MDQARGPDLSGQEEIEEEAGAGLDSEEHAHVLGVAVGARFEQAGEHGQEAEGDHDDADEESMRKRRGGWLRT